MKDVKDLIVIVNPATEEVIAELPKATREDVRRAIDAAWDAFASWSALPLRKRTRVLLKTAELAETAREDLLKTLVAESGKPIRDAEAEITRAIDIFRSSAEEAKLILEGSVPRVDAYEYPIGNENRLVVAVREPVGVVGGPSATTTPPPPSPTRLPPSSRRGTQSS